jgi:hypothetical protein
MTVSSPGQRLSHATSCTGAAESDTTAGARLTAAAPSATAVNAASPPRPSAAGTSAIAKGCRETLGVGVRVWLGVPESVRGWEGLRLCDGDRVPLPDAPTLKV